MSAPGYESDAHPQDRGSRPARALIHALSLLGGSWELVEPLGWPLGPLGMASGSTSALAEPWATPSLSRPAQLEITDIVIGWMWLKPRTGANSARAWGARVGSTPPPPGAGHLSFCHRDPFHRLRVCGPKQPSSGVKTEVYQLFRNRNIF